MSDPVLRGEKPTIGQRYDNFFKNKDGSNCVLIDIKPYRGAYPEFLNCVLVFHCDKHDRPAERAYQVLDPSFVIGACHKCGASLGPGGYCNDITCPYSDVKQDVPLPAIYGEEVATYHRKSPLLLMVTTDCGRLSLEIDCSGFLMAAHQIGTLTDFSEKLQGNEPGQQQICEQIVYAYRASNQDLDRLLTYCEAATNAGIEDSGFSCKIDPIELSSFLQQLPG